MSGRPLAAVGLLAATLGAQTPAPPSSSDSRPEERVLWSAERRLSWSDFRADAPRGSIGAESMLGYHYTLGCQGGELERTFVPFFKPALSWVSSRVVTDGHRSRMGLRHEQVHFDLKEVHARRLRKYFAELARPCTRTDAELDRLAHRLFEDEAGLQRRFDMQARDREDERVLGEWERQIARDLALLDAFATPTSPSERIGRTPK